MERCEEFGSLSRLSWRSHFVTGFVLTLSRSVGIASGTSGFSLFLHMDCTVPCVCAVTLLFVRNLAIILPWMKTAESPCALYEYQFEHMIDLKAASSKLKYPGRLSPIVESSWQQRAWCFVCMFVLFIHRPGLTWSHAAAIYIAFPGHDVRLIYNQSEFRSPDPPNLDLTILFHVSSWFRFGLRLGFCRVRTNRLVPVLRDNSIICLSQITELYSFKLISAFFHTIELSRE
jgi:hypothetical protein